MPALVGRGPCAQSNQPGARHADPLLGAWSGRVHSGDESRPIGMRFEVNAKKSTIVFYDTPELKFQNIGPIPMHKTGDGYKIYRHPYGP